MRDSRSFSLAQLATWVVLGFTLVIPLIVLPFTEQLVSDAKVYTLFVFSLVLGGLFVATTLQKRVIRFTVTSLTLPVVLFAAAVLASSFFVGQYPVEHLLGLGGVYIACALIVLFGSSLVKRDQATESVLGIMVLASTLLTLASGLQAAGAGPSTLINQALGTNIPNTLVFNVAGSSIAAAQFLTITLVGLAVYIARAKRVVLYHLIGVGVVGVGLALHVWSVMPGQVAEQVLLPFGASWSIAVDVLKSPRGALIGVGPDAFRNAYSQLRPAWINGQSFWSVRFNQASSAPFMFLTTLGLLGFGSWVFLVIRSLSETKRVAAETKPLQMMLLASFALQLILPLNIVVLATQAVLLVFWSASERERFSVIEIYGLTVRFVKSKNVGQPLTTHGRAFLYGFSFIVAVLLLGLSYGVGRAYWAQTRVLAAARAAQSNDAVGTYNNLQQAVRLNPYLDTIRRRYAVTNITIAAALSQNAERTEQENQQFSQLVQQAIREGRAATLLDPQDAANWAVLAQIYRPLIGVAEGADQWAVNSYVSAIQASPNDPTLRIELGGIFYAAEQYAQATQFFEQAVSLKGDLPNALYNLANSYREAGNLEASRRMYQETLRLVQPDTDDYVRAQEELQEVEALLAEAAEEQSDQPADQADQTDQGTSSTTAPSILDENINTSAQETLSQPQEEPLETAPEGAAVQDSDL